MDGNRVAGIVDKQLLAGPVLCRRATSCARSHPLYKITEPAVALAVRGLLAVLLPQELQGDVLVGLQFVADRSVVWLGRLLPVAGFSPRRSRGFQQSVFTPIGNVRPFQPGRVGIPSES